MTAQKKFKQLVRERMTMTGESYTAARRAIESEGRPAVHFEPVCHCGPSPVHGPRCHLAGQPRS